jgi:prevent-host-death family protein
MVYTWRRYWSSERSLMMVRTMSSREARANFAELLGLVYFTKEPVIVERKGKPYAVVISPEHFAALQKGLERVWATVDDIRERNTEYDPDDVLADVTAEVEAVRQEMYDERRGVRKRRR